MDAMNILHCLKKKKKTSVSSRTVVYKCFCPLSKKIKFLDNANIWKYLHPVLGDVSLVKRGETYATVAVRFSTAEEARRNSDKTLKTEEAVLLPSYMGRITSRIRIEEVTPETKVTRVMAALLQGHDDKVTILKINRISKKHWCGQAAEVFVQASPEVLENMPNRLIFVFYKI